MEARVSPTFNDVRLTSDVIGISSRFPEQKFLNQLAICFKNDFIVSGLDVPEYSVDLDLIIDSGEMVFNGRYCEIPETTITLVDNNTNWIFIKFLKDDSQNIKEAQYEVNITGNVPANSFYIARAVASGGEITSVVDKRILTSQPYQKGMLVGTTNTTFELPAGVDLFKIEAIGGGGGGSGSFSNGFTVDGSGGGGAAGYIQQYIQRQSIDHTLNITIGSGGAGGSSGNIGSDGTDTVITDGVNTITAKGGFKSVVPDILEPRIIGGAGGGQVSESNKFGVTGQGGDNYYNDASGTLFVNAFYRVGGQTKYGFSNLIDTGVGYGAGGGGSTSGTGRAGRPGIVVITWGDI